MKMTIGMLYALYGVKEIQGTYLFKMKENVFGNLLDSYITMMDEQMECGE